MRILRLDERRTYYIIKVMRINGFLIWYSNIIHTASSVDDRIDTSTRFYMENHTSSSVHAIQVMKKSKRIHNTMLYFDG